jgi:hypothetical protein
LAVLRKPPFVQRKAGGAVYAGLAHCKMLFIESIGDIFA